MNPALPLSAYCFTEPISLQTFQAMTPIKVLPSRTEDLEQLPASTKEDIKNTACAHGAAEDEVDSNPALRSFYKGILTEVGEDPQRVGLLRTPHRAAKAMEYLTSGYTM